MVALRRRFGSSNILSPIHGLQDCRANTWQCLQTLSWQVIFQDFEENIFLHQATNIEKGTSNFHPSYSFSLPFTNLHCHIKLPSFRIQLQLSKTYGISSRFFFDGLKQTNIVYTYQKNCRPPHKVKTKCLNGRVGTGSSAGRFGMIQKNATAAKQTYENRSCLHA